MWGFHELLPGFKYKFPLFIKSPHFIQANFSQRKLGPTGVVGVSILNWRRVYGVLFWQLRPGNPRGKEQHSAHTSNYITQATTAGPFFKQPGLRS